MKHSGFRQRYILNLAVRHILVILVFKTENSDVLEVKP